MTKQEPLINQVAYNFSDIDHVGTNSPCLSSCLNDDPDQHGVLIGQFSYKASCMAVYDSLILPS
jgi:hypothetical protein